MDMSRSLSSYRGFNRFDFIINTLVGAISDAFTNSYLLDNITGASAAYSLRQLRKAATKCIKVRRSSDDTEQDFGFKNGYLDTAALLTFVGVSNGFVSKWYDQSLGGHDATSATFIYQPRIVNAGVLEVSNGKTAVYFNSSASAGEGLWTAPFQARNASGEWMAFGVCQPFDAIGNRLLWNGDDTATVPNERLAQFIRQSGTNFQTIGFNSVGGNGSASTPKVVGTQQIVSALRDVGNVSIQRNNVAIVTTAIASGNSVKTPICSIGNFGSEILHGNANWKGWIQEIIHFNSQSPALREILRVKINEYYGAY
jgi:hypothetical protein